MALLATVRRVRVEHRHVHPRRGEATYTFGDLALTIIGSGGCGGGQFEMSIDVRDADTGFTMVQPDSPWSRWAPPSTPCSTNAGWPITLDGTLEARGSTPDGEVDVAADVLWVMGCP